MTNDKSHDDLNAPASGCWLQRFVRRMEIAIRWQYRRKVFFSAVIKSVWSDVKMSLLAMLIGLLFAPLVLVLTIPCRLLIWALSPIFMPFVKMDGKYWLMMLEIIEKRNPPNIVLGVSSATDKTQ